jgi:putative ABC transport system permease protein
MGLVLRLVFERDSWVLTLGILLVMAVAAAHSIRSRLAQGGWASRALPTWGDTALVLGTLAFTSFWIVRWTFQFPTHAAAPDSFLAPPLIPLIGMVLGNSLSALTLALERFRHELGVQRLWVESRILAGATAQESLRPVLHLALRASATPMLNALSAAGLVSLPGAMTGQVLAGQSPLQAAWVQFVILGLLMLASAGGAFLLLHLWVAHRVDPLRGVWRGVE